MIWNNIQKQMWLGRNLFFCRPYNHKFRWAYLYQQIQAANIFFFGKLGLIPDFNWDYHCHMFQAEQQGPKKFMIYNWNEDTMEYIEFSPHCNYFRKIELIFNQWELAAPIDLCQVMLVHSVICAISMTIPDGSLRQSVGCFTMTLLRK